MTRAGRSGTQGVLLIALPVLGLGLFVVSSLAFMDTLWSQLGLAASLLSVSTIFYLRIGRWRRKKVSASVVSLVLLFTMGFGILSQVTRVTASPDTFYLHDSNTSSVVQFDDVTVDRNTASRSSGSFFHTTSGAERLLLVFVLTLDASAYATGTDVTYGGQGLTFLMRDQYDAGTPQLNLEIWYLVNPPTGSNQVSFTLSQADESDSIVAISYTGVDQTTPVGPTASNSAGSGTNPTVDLTTGNASSMIVGGVIMYNGDTGPFTPGPDTVERWDGSTGAGGSNNADAGGEESATTTGTYTFNFTSSASGSWVIGAVEVNVGGSSISPSGKYMNATQGSGGASITFDTLGQEAYWYTDTTFTTRLESGDYTFNMFFSELPDPWWDPGWWNTSWTRRQSLTFDNLESTITTVEVRVSASTDDAEEALTTGVMDLTSTDLELIDEATAQEVGMRFLNLQVPRQATIVNAYIEFTVDEASTVDTNLTFYGEDVDDAATFTSTAYNITSRTKTSASILWGNVLDWPTGTLGRVHRTPNLAPIIQEIVDRNGWGSGNDLVVIVAGNGVRVAEAYNGVAASAPLLHVEYSETLLNFPVLAKLDSSRIDYGQVQNAGEDLRFIDSDGATPLAHEIEEWNESGTSYVWVNVSHIPGHSTTDFIWMYYGNSSVADGQNVAGVWNNAYVAVWHLNETPTGSADDIQDSTSNANHATSQGSMDSNDQIVAKVDGGLDFDGTDDYLEVCVDNCPTSLRITGTEFTLEAWARIQSPGVDNDKGLIDKRDAGNDERYYLGIGSAEVLNCRATTATAHNRFDQGAVPTDQWVYLVCRYDGSTLKGYIDASEIASIAATGTVNDTASDDVILGKRYNSRWYEGDMDELRISNVARSADWIAAQHKSMNDTFITYSGGENRSEYLYRKPITITAGPYQVPPGYSVNVSFNHQQLVSESKSQSDGDDVRVVYWDGTRFTELDRVLDVDSAWNGGATEIWFKTQASIAASGSTSDYFLYYGNDTATNPPEDPSNVYLFWDGFESGDLGRWTAQIDSVWSVESDQANNGTYSLRASSAVSTNKWITADGVNHANVLLDARWRLSSTSSDVDQAFRANESSVLDTYSTNLETTAGWNIARWVNDVWTELASNQDSPTANTWTKITTVIFGQNMKVLKDDVQINPTSGWFDVGTNHSSGSVGFHTWTVPAGNYWWIDDVILRRYVETEPTATLGSEGSGPTSAVQITVSVYHTKTDGSDAQEIVTSSTKSIDNVTANPYALSIGTGGTVGFSASDPRLLRLRINVTGVTGGAQFGLAYDSSANLTSLVIPRVAGVLPRLTDPSLTPTSGSPSTFFNFTIDYSHPLGVAANVVRANVSDAANSTYNNFTMSPLQNPEVDYFVQEYWAINGSVANFGNAQSDADSGAYASLVQAQGTGPEGDYESTRDPTACEAVGTNWTDCDGAFASDNVYAYANETGLASTWYVRDPTSTATGCDVNKELQDTAGSAAINQGLNPGALYCYYTSTLSVTIPSGDWTAFVELTSGGGSGKQVRITVDITDSSGTVQETVADCTTGSDPSGEFACTATGVAAKTLSNQRLRLRVERTTGTGTMQLRYNGAAGGDGDSRVTIPVSGNDTAWKDFGIDLGSNTFNRVEVGVEWFRNNTAPALSVSISWDGGTSWATNQTATNQSADPNALEFLDFTSATTWDELKLNDTNLRVRVWTNASGARLDHVVVRVNFTAGSGTDIILDATSSSSSTSSPLTFSHTVGSGANRLLVVTIAVEGSPSNADLTDVTYNSVSLAKAVDRNVGTGTDMNVEIWYMLDADLPAAGSYTVSITTAGTIADIIAGAVSVFGPAQQAPEATASNDDGGAGNEWIETQITTSTDGSWIVDVVGIGDDLRTFSPNSGQTERYDISGASSSSAGSRKNVPTAGTETINWTVEGGSVGTRIAQALAAFAPAPDSLELLVQFNTTGIRSSGEDTLVLRYNLTSADDTFEVWVWNFTAGDWANRGTLDQTAVSFLNYTLTGDEKSSGEVRIRFNDTSITGATDLSIDYQLVNNTLWPTGVTYYVNTTLAAGWYSHFFWANDTNGQSNQTATLAGPSVNAGPAISNFRLENATAVSRVGEQLDVDVDYFFLFNVTDENGWTDIGDDGNVSLRLWYDGNQTPELTYDQQTTGANYRIELKYVDTADPATASLSEWSVTEGRATYNESASSLTAITNGYEFKLALRLGFQVKQANDPTDSSTGDYNDNNSWDAEVVASDGIASSTLQTASTGEHMEFGVYMYTFVNISANWAVTLGPGDTQSTNTVTVYYRSNDDFRMRIWFVTDLDSGSDTIGITNVTILAAADPNDNITSDLTFNGLGIGNAEYIFGSDTWWIAHDPDNDEGTVVVQFSVTVPYGTTDGTYTAQLTIRIQQVPAG